MLYGGGDFVLGGSGWTLVPTEEIPEPSLNTFLGPNQINQKPEQINFGGVTFRNKIHGHDLTHRTRASITVETFGHSNEFDFGFGAVKNGHIAVWNKILSLKILI